MQGGYETEANLAPLVAEAQATGQSLAYLLISRNLALPGVVVGALAHLAQLPAVDLAAMTPSPEASAAMSEAVGREFEAVALQFDGNVLAVAFSEPPSQRGRRRAGVDGSATGSTRCWPIRRSSPSCSDSVDGAPDPLPRPGSAVAAGRPGSQRPSPHQEERLARRAPPPAGIPRTGQTGPCPCTSTTCCATRWPSVRRTST